MLTRSTPEGARDYLVPSRIYPGYFFALPQSPQLFKQILMVAGFERYFQFARCFRDEDLRADRQPEFTQLDIEMSFIGEEEIMELMEEMMAVLFGQLLGKEVAEAVSPPDLPGGHGRLRVRQAGPAPGHEDRGLSLILPAAAPARFFRGGAGRRRGQGHPGARRRFAVPPGTGRAGKAGWRVGGQGPGLVYPGRVRRSGRRWPSMFQQTELQQLVRQAGRAAGRPAAVRGRPAGGGVRPSSDNCAWSWVQRFNLAEPDRFAFVWITDFPLFEYNDTEKRLEAMHHPFTAPREEDLHLLEKTPGQVRARAYDLVLNGTEIGGGSIRNHRRDVQDRLFKAIGLAPEEIAHKFGFLLDALDYGAPPHGGIAFGFDRMMMLMLRPGDYPGRDRLSQDPEFDLPDDRGPGASRGEAAFRSAHRSQDYRVTTDEKPEGR